MKLKLLQLREQLQTSIWFIPAMLCLGALVLASALIGVERDLGTLIPVLKTFAMPITSARSVLGVIAGAVLSVGGVVFSMTMVALTLTSGQYGPKLLRQFLGDNGSKISLGMFFGTSLYCLVTLAAYRDDDEPGITVLVALILTIVALAGFIRFIHRTATDLQADQIIQRIGGELRDSLRQLTATENQLGRQCETAGWRRKARELRPVSIAGGKEGYVQTIDYPGIVRWCVEHDCICQLQARAGDFLLPGSRLVKVYGYSGELSDDALRTLRDYVTTGPIRTPVQDPEYPITQLNQLVARALSPGINDPGTAITCIDWLSMAVAELVDRDIPGKVFLDDEGESRLLARFTDFPGILEAFYDPARQFARDNLPVLIRLADSLIRLAELTTLQPRLDLLAEQGRELSDITERGQHTDSDLKDFRQRYRKLLRVTSRLSS